MSSRPALDGRDLVVLAALTRAAKHGAPCPSNDDIIAMTITTSRGTAAAIVKKLETCGLITVERFNRARRVTIIDTGCRTAAVAGRPRVEGTRANHRAAMADFSARKQADRAKAKAEDEDRLAALIGTSADREPCFRCGTRGDVGCRHKPIISGPRPAAGSPAVVAPLAAAGAPSDPLFHG